MKSILLSAALLLAAGAALAAGPRDPQSLGLSAPIVALTPVLAANMETLGLDAAQQAQVATFVATMPARRMAFEDEVVAMRAALTKAILLGAPEAERANLAQAIGAAETKLLLMRSACADTWRKLLTPAQFEALVALAVAK